MALDSSNNRLTTPARVGLDPRETRAMHNPVGPPHLEPQQHSHPKQQAGQL